MKKTITAILFSIALTTPLQAQPGRPDSRRHYIPPRPSYNHYHRDYAAADAYFGMRLGLSAATVRSDDRYLDGSTPQAGFNAGVVAGFQVAPAVPICLETGLYYIEKGGKGSLDGRDFTYSLNYIELPFLMKYCANITADFSVQPFAGAFAAVGVGGKMKDFGSRQAYSAYDDEGFRRLDAGLRIGCGIQFAHLYAEMGYDIGLANISRDYFDDAHTGCFFVTAGLNF
jgi:hypothetical protein